MFAAGTDHVFLDGGHTLDFTNKAFESLDELGWPAAGAILPALIEQTAEARRLEEEGSWRHPEDLAGIARSATGRLESLGDAALSGRGLADGAVEALAWRLLVDDPSDAVDGLLEGLESGATPEQAGRAVALAAGLRIARFGVQNDHGDWDVVHHGFTYANALHQALVRAPSVELLRGAVHGVLKVYLDRFLNVPAARPPELGAVDLDALAACWDQQGQVDRAGAIVYGWVRSQGRPGTGHRRPGSRPHRRGRRIPLVSNGGGRRPPGRGVAGRIRATGDVAGRGRPVPGRPHPYPSRASTGRAHRPAPAAG